LKVELSEFIILLLKLMMVKTGMLTLQKPCGVLGATKSLLSPNAIMSYLLLHPQSLV